jgi:ABC-type nitrate/sulfonate/bicarbonate transport system substrate-binding protein
MERKTMKNLRGAFAAVAAGLMLLTACGGEDSSAGKASEDSEQLTVAIGTEGTFEFIPAELGLELGVWKERGLDVKNLNVQGSGEVAQALTAGEADMAATAGSSTIASIVKGVPQKLVAGIGSNDFKTMVVVVPKDSDITEVADLKGKTIGVTSPGSGTDYLAQVLQKKEGWSDSDLKRAAIGGLQEQLAAMESGSTDAFVWSIEAAYTLEESGDGRILTNFGFLDNELFEVLNVTDTTIKSKSDAVQDYIDGWFETVKYMQDNPDKVVAFITKNFQVSDKVAQQIYDFGMPIMSKDGTIPQNVLDGLAQSLVTQGLTAEAPAADTWWDDQFVPATVG